MRTRDEITVISKTAELQLIHFMSRERRETFFSVYLLYEKLFTVFVLYRAIQNLQAAGK